MKSKENKTPLETTELELSKTRQILWRFSKVEKNVNRKRTTFSELFFDLAVVFIFALLASRLMGSLGHSVMQVEANAKAVLGLPTEIIETNNHWIGFFFWIVHFVALWLTWYQFSNYTKYHWIDNVGNNFLTLMLIFTLILQGAGIYFVDENIANYSLIVSFLSARLIFVIAQYIAVHNSPKIPISHELMIKTKRQAIVCLGTLSLFIIYLGFTFAGLLTVSEVKYNSIAITIFDPWKKDAFMIGILVYHFAARLIWKVVGKKYVSRNSYNIIFHTKERHHLFIIIALGELLVVTLTSSFINNQTPSADWNTISYMFITPFIAITIWYVYKTVFYKASPVNSKINYYLYIICHMVIVLGILVFLGSIKSHMQADAFHKTGSITKIDDPVSDVSRTYYSLGAVIGFSMITIPMAVYAVFIKFKQERWGAVVRGLAPILVIKSILICAWLVIEIILFWINIKVHFSTVIYTTLCIELLFALLLIWKSQKVIITQFKTVAEFDKYSSKLDH